MSRVWVVRAAMAAMLVCRPAAGPAVAAQSPLADIASPDAEWLVIDDAFAHLWFHCLALIGYEGYSPLPLYDRAYAARVREAKRRAGLVTALDREGLDLRRALERDSVLEIAHFLPLYFVGGDPTVVLGALRNAVAPSTPHGTPGPPAASAAARAIAATIPTRRAQITFLKVLHVADEEWRLVVRSQLAATAGERRGRIRALQDNWNREFIGPLSSVENVVPFRGTIVVSNALGSEGRTARSPDGRLIVAVGLNDRSADAEAPLFAAVRELSFPFVHGARRVAARPLDRIANERVSDIAATRAGALLLDALAPTLGTRYRSVFRANSRTGDGPFETLYPLDSADESNLRHVVHAALRTASKR